MDIKEKIRRLEVFKSHLNSWQRDGDDKSRQQINQEIVWVRREVIKAKCNHTLTITPPLAFGGFIRKNVDPFNIIFENPSSINVVPGVIDMIDKTIGVLCAESSEPLVNKPQVHVDANIQKNYAFIVMPIVRDNGHYEDVLEAIKEAAKRCGIHAERVDEHQSNDRITNRILESIQKAEYVIVDLTDSRPNVFYEAGYAQGINKTPIYIARKDTKIEFDLNDYPIIFFSGFTNLKNSLEDRLRGLVGTRKT